MIDGAGWHTAPNLTVPEGLHLVYLPPYTPQLQPAECLWPVLDEPVANRHFETIEELDAVVARRCLTLDESRTLQGAYRLPLVAQKHLSELISRMRYELLL